MWRVGASRASRWWKGEGDRNGELNFILSILLSICKVMPVDRREMLYRVHGMWPLAWMNMPDSICPTLLFTFYAFICYYIIVIILLTVRYTIVLLPFDTATFHYLIIHSCVVLITILFCPWLHLLQSVLLFYSALYPLLFVVVDAYYYISIPISYYYCHCHSAILFTFIVTLTVNSVHRWCIVVHYHCAGDLITVLLLYCCCCSIRTADVIRRLFYR